VAADLFVEHNSAPTGTTARPSCPSAACAIAQPRRSPAIRSACSSDRPPLAGDRGNTPVVPRIDYRSRSGPSRQQHLAQRHPAHRGLRRPIQSGVGRVALLPPRLPLSLSHCRREGCTLLCRNALPPLPRPRRRRPVAAPRPRRIVVPLPHRLRIHADLFAGALLQGRSGE
jgi:hypothetical protein